MFFLGLEKFGKKEWKTTYVFYFFTFILHNTFFNFFFYHSTNILTLSPLFFYFSKVRTCKLLSALQTQYARWLYQLHQITPRAQVT